MRSEFVDVFKNVEISEAITHNFHNRGTTFMVARLGPNGQLKLKWATSTEREPDMTVLVQKTLFSGYTVR